MIKRVEMPSMTYIVARSVPEHAIGVENCLPWRLKTDMNFFRATTHGHAVIMGRRTLESIGKPLAGRLNIVLTRQASDAALIFRGYNNLAFVSSREEALFAADIFSILQQKKSFFIIGGDQIYDLFVDLFYKIYLTEVFTLVPNADAFFKKKFDMRSWSRVVKKLYEQSEFDQFPFQIQVLERKRKTIRSRMISEFYSNHVNDTLIGSREFLRKAKKLHRLPDEQINLPLVA
jgi:dihydrofolate reductase